VARRGGGQRSPIGCAASLRFISHAAKRHSSLAGPPQGRRRS